MKSIPVASLVAVVVLALTLGVPEPAAAQVVPQSRNAAGIDIATFSAAPVYSLGIAFRLSPTVDATLAYKSQTVAGVAGTLFGLGARYHFAVAAPGVDTFAGIGLASSSGTLPGFGTLNASGWFLGAGASFRLGGNLTGYASGSLFSLGAVQKSIIDVGVRIQLAPLVSGQLGYLNLSGSGAPYLGVSLNFP